MDDQNKNLMLAMALSMLVIIGWYSFFAPPTPTPDLTAVPATTQIAETPSADASADPVTLDGSADTGAAATPSSMTAATAPRVIIDTPRLAGSISLLGGSLDDLLLKDYRETIEADAPDVRLLGYDGAKSTTDQPVQPYFVNYGWRGDAVTLPTTATLWAVESGTTLTPQSPITLVWDNGAGLIFRRQIEVDENYMFTVTQSVQNNSDAAVKLAPYGLVLRQGIPAGPSTYVLHQGSIGMADGTLHDLTYKKLTKLPATVAEGPVDVVPVATGGWIGLTDKYWMTTLIPEPGQPFDLVAKYIPKGDYYVTSTRLPELAVAPGASVSSKTMLFAGAKEWETIRTYEKTLGIGGFVDSIDWGWFFFLTKPMFWLLHTLHGLIGNMGFAIIALTFIIKAAVFPLARKSYVSMAKMKELQPEMEKLKEAAGDDRQKMQKGMMELYKKEKVNPASGCLPILLQIPIFYSLYKVIYVTLELRHAAWIGWIRDLSAPDPSSILNLFGLLPWATPEPGSLFFILSLGVLPILLGISMWFQQKLNPAPTDATQAAVFAWMPWIFMFMLGSFASGLVLYWITNNTITFLQQYTIMAMHGKRPDIFGNIKSGMRRNKAAEK
ncbi:MAG: membrane protein insertase YidC [Paracoccaceae bacterium]